jgi:hypothetical protein
LSCANAGTTRAVNNSTAAAISAFFTIMDKSPFIQVRRYQSAWAIEAR